MAALTLWPDQKRNVTEEEREKSRKYLREQFKPTPYLLPDCHPTLRKVPNLAYYGFAVTRKELIDYAKKHGLYDANKWSTETLRCLVAYDEVVWALSKKVGFRLELRNPISVDTPWMVALYSNFVVNRKRLPAEEESVILGVIADELELPEDRLPLWYHDIRFGCEEMRVDPWYPLTREQMSPLIKAYEEIGIEVTDAAVNRDV